MSHLTAAVFIALLLNSAYLVGIPTALIWYYAKVGLHPLLDLRLAVVMARRGSPPGPRLGAFTRTAVNLA